MNRTKPKSWSWNFEGPNQKQQQSSSTLPETNSSHLKMDGWNWTPTFSHGLFIPQELPDPIGSKLSIWSVVFEDTNQPFVGFNGVVVFSWKPNSPRLNRCFSLFESWKLPRFLTKFLDDRCRTSTPNNIKQLTCFFRWENLTMHWPEMLNPLNLRTNYLGGSS